MASKPLQSRRILLFIVVGIVVFSLYLYYYVGIGNFIDVLAKANLYYYISAFAAFIVGVFFAALTWQSLLSPLKIKISFRLALLLTWAGYFFDSTLPEPGWSGDISKAYMLSKQSEEDMGKIVASVVGQKIIGMATTIFMLLAGFGLLAINVALPLPALILVAVIMVISVASLVVVYYLSTSPKATKTMVNWLTRVLSFVLRKHFHEAQFRTDAQKFLRVFHEGIATLSSERKALVRPIALYILSLVFDISVVFFTFAALGYIVPVDKVLIVYALTGALQSIGVSFFGFTDTIMSLAYTVLLIDPAVSVSVTLLTRIITLWFKLIISYFALQYTGVGILLGKKPKPLQSNEAKTELPSETS